MAAVEGIVEVIRRGFTQAFRLQGRATRAEFWWFWLLFGAVQSLTDGSPLAPITGDRVARPRRHGARAPAPAAPTLPAVNTGVNTGHLAPGWFLAAAGNGPADGAGPGDRPATGGWPHGDDHLPPSAGWDDVPPPPPTGPRR